MQAMPPNFAVYSLIGLVALANDLVDYATVVFTITGFWLAVLKVIDVATGIILITWAFMSGVQKTTKSKKAKNRIWRFVFSWVVEMIPILGELSPTWTITVFLAWREHRKIYRQSLAQFHKDRQSQQQQQTQEQSEAQLEGKYAQQMEGQQVLQEAV